MTASGRRFVHKVLPSLFPHLAALFQGFSAADKKQFDRLLHKLVGNLDSMALPKDPRA